MKLLPMQRDDFKGLYREMKGYPVDHPAAGSGLSTSSSPNARS